MTRDGAASCVGVSVDIRELRRFAYAAASAHDAHGHAVVQEMAVYLGVSALMHSRCAIGDAAAARSVSHLGAVVSLLPLNFGSYTPSSVGTVARLLQCPRGCIGAQRGPGRAPWRMTSATYTQSSTLH